MTPSQWSLDSARTLATGGPQRDVKKYMNKKRPKLWRPINRYDLLAWSIHLYLGCIITLTLSIVAVRMKSSLFSVLAILGSLFCISVLSIMLLNVKFARMMRKLTFRQRRLLLRKLKPSKVKPLPFSRSVSGTLFMVIGVTAVCIAFLLYFLSNT